MNENRQLPDPAPKSDEQEKWKAMVDSVIEFISASRVMLHVLNERLRDSEMYKDEERKRLEDEKQKLAFYRECLHMEIKPTLFTKSAFTDAIIPKKMPWERGDNGDICQKGELDKEKVPETEKIKFSSKEIKEVQVSDFKEYTNTEQQMSTESSKVFNHVDSHSQVQNDIFDTKSNQIACKMCRHQHSHAKQDTKENCCLLTMIEQESIHSSDDRTRNESPKKRCSRHHSKSRCPKHGVEVKKSQISTQTTAGIEIVNGAAFGNGRGETRNHPSGILGPKCHRVSRIPRTKSFCEERNKCIIQDRTAAPNEGPNIGKSQCVKKCLKENTYSHIHRTKAPLGNSTTRV